METGPLNTEKDYRRAIYNAGCMMFVAENTLNSFNPRKPGKLSRKEIASILQDAISTKERLIKEACAKFDLRHTEYNPNGARPIINWMAQD